VARRSVQRADRATADFLISSPLFLDAEHLVARRSARAPGAVPQ
jgi:hypothetical protein